MRKKVHPDEALELLLALSRTVGSENVPLYEACGRVLAEDIRARVNVPPFARSPYDGYAFRSADSAGASRETPVTLRVIEELPAGTVPTKTVTEGTAVKILTGAPIPEGADVVVKYETTEFGGDWVRIFEPAVPRDIVPVGEDIACGDLVAEAGTVINPAVTGLLAGQGIAQVPVYKKPRIRVMSTGSELLEPGDENRPGKIYNSNVYTISAYLRGMGAECENGGSLPDEPEAIAAAISKGLDECDMVVTTGGASVGDYDYAVRAAERAGAEVLFWKAAMKPGGAIMAAQREGKVLLSLSGNPGAAIVGLLRMAAPYVKSLCGRRDIRFREISCILKEPYKKASPQLRYVRGRLSVEDGKAYFLLQEGQGNGVVSSFNGCDLLGEIAEGSPAQPAGAAIKAYILD